MTPGKDTAPKTGEDAAQKAREIRVCLFQPPYPHAGTEAAAAECRAWMQEQLDALAPGDQDLILLPEYATTPGLQDRERLRACAESEGAAFRDAAASRKAAPSDSAHARRRSLS